MVELSTILGSNGERGKNTLAYLATSSMTKQVLLDKHSCLLIALLPGGQVVEHSAHNPTIEVSNVKKHSSLFNHNIDDKASFIGQTLLLIGCSQVACWYNTQLIMLQLRFQMSKDEKHSSLFSHIIDDKASVIGHSCLLVVPWWPSKGTLNS